MTIKYTNPRFQPKIHGFKFDNDFKNFVTTIPWLNLPIPPGFQFTTEGRCGGMSQAAADYFIFKREVPQVSKLPVDGDALGDYILNRQYDSFVTVGPDILTAASIPGMASAWNQQTTPPNGTFFQQLCGRINSNKPCPIAYIPRGYNLSNLGSGHQVLAIGYSKDDKAIYIYDPNYHDQEITLKYEENVWKVYLPGETKPKQTLIAWFPDLEYVPQDPSRIFDLGSEKNFTGRDLRHWKPPSHQDLTKYIFYRANLAGNGNLSSCDMTGVDARYANFSGCRLVQCDLQNMKLYRANLSGTDLTGSTLSGSNMKRASLKNARLNETVLNDVSAADTNFQNSRLANVTFKDTVLDRADFQQASLNNVTFQGTDHNTFSSCFNLRCPQAALKKITFRNLNLNFAYFYQVAMSNIQFENTNLTGANFIQSAMENVTFKDVDFAGSFFTGAALNGVTFQNVKNWQSSVWIGASLKNCRFYDPSLLGHILRTGGRF